MSAAGDRNDHPRVVALIEQFRRVDAAMRELPIYNSCISIEAIGFRLFGETELLGVLITPWFMNLLILPIEPVPMDMAKIGKTVAVDLPAGPRTFVVSGDAAVGLYRAHSLHSPVSTFTLPGQAAAEARRLLATLTTLPAATAAAGGNNTSAGVARRALLFGRGNA